MRNKVLLFEFFFKIILLVICGGIENVDSVRFLSPNEQIKQLQVQTRGGLVQGHLKQDILNKSPYYAFQGIPYAKPPIGQLRFRSPKRFGKWAGVLDATKDGSNCVELKLRATTFIVGSEDCLYLNVYTRQSPSAIKQLLPVMVWIHGGGYLEGNGGNLLYSPDYLLEENVLLVTMNYRLGLFGFFSTGDLAAPGNFGFKDQHLVLKWVQSNIKFFGGDPNLVTIFGQSAGATSVMFHVESPKGRGLFHRAIAESGSTFCSFTLQRNPRGIAFDVAASVGIKTNSTQILVEQLRKADSELLKKAYRDTTQINMVAEGLHGFPYAAVLEPQHKDAFLTEASYAVLESGKFHKVPLLTGVTTNEMLYFLPVFQKLRPILVLYDIARGLLALPSMNIASLTQRRNVGLEIESHYFKNQLLAETSDEELLNYLNDDQFYRPIAKSVQLISRHVPTYFYVFGYSGEMGFAGLEGLLEDKRTRQPIPGVAHSEELWYMWRSRDIYPTNPVDRLMGQRLVRMWTNFAKTGNPTPEKDVLLQNIIWPVMKSPTNLTYLNIDKDLSLGRNFRQNGLKFWDYLYEKYGTPPYDTY